MINQLWEASVASNLVLLGEALLGGRFALGGICSGKLILERSHISSVPSVFPKCHRKELLPGDARTEAWRGIGLASEFG